MRALVVGVCLPGAAITSVTAKAGLASELAARLQKALGQPVSGRLYGRAEDLESDLPQLAFVLVDAPLAALLRGQGGPLAVTVRGASDRTRLALYGTAQVPAAWGLRGKRLAMVRLGRATTPLVENFLFQGELPLSQVVRVPVPDAASAIAAVRLGKADAVVLTEAAFSGLAGEAADLKLRFASEGMPLAVFGHGGATTDAQTSARARATILSFAAPAAGLDGFRPAGGEVLASLRRGMAAVPRRQPPVAEPGRGFRGPPFSASRPEVPLPPLRSYLAPLPVPPEP